MELTVEKLSRLINGEVVEFGEFKNQVYIDDKDGFVLEGYVGTVDGVNQYEVVDAYDSFYQELVNVININYSNNWVYDNFNSSYLGKEFTAEIGLDRPWVDYSGELSDPNYYRDVWVGRLLAYCYGETCKVCSYEEETMTISLKNAEDRLFSIPLDQFLVDFII